MHNTYQLFSAEEAFVRLGQSRDRGCLVVVSAESSVRLFVEEGCVVQADGEKSKGEYAIQEALHLTDSSYVWIPEVESKQKAMRLNITAYVIKHSIARDTRMRVTGKVAIKEEQTAVHKAAAPRAPVNSIPDYYLVADGYDKEDLRIRKATNIIGRDPTSDIVLQNIQVSRRHCLLEVQAKGVFLKDLGSTNGIKINGKVVTEGFITTNDLMEFGTYKVALKKD
jgi:hypothetical protein